MRAIKAGLITVAAAATLMAATNARVFVTERGKTYHQSKTCMALSRSSATVHDVAEQAAIAHGLKKCGLCWREKKQHDTGWMKEGK